MYNFANLIREDTFIHSCFSILIKFSLMYQAEVWSLTRARVLDEGHVFI